MHTHTRQHTGQHTRQHISPHISPHASPQTRQPMRRAMRRAVRLAMHRPMRQLIALLTLGSAAVASAAPTCQATAPAVPPTVVELYTSEGCSSCPPADQWLSTLKGRPDVLPLAFHVNYWDYLGWRDRFASAEATDRQQTLGRASGGGGVYTPQVLAGGRDWRGWPRLPAATAVPSPVALTLVREGDIVTAQIDAKATSAARLAGYWAVTEDQHLSKVRAGENSGETLRHDAVVRLYKPVAAWAAGSPQTLQLQVSRGEPAFPRRVVFVVTDAQTQRPLQAVALSCPA